ncbi:hypothetical protein ACKWMU_12765, partial [Escherichia coli]
MARPTKYQEAYAEQARKLCLLGYTDAELADFFEVSESTINKWKLDYPEFSESIKKGMNRPGFPGECFICELRLPDHRFRWKHNKLFLLL